MVIGNTCVGKTYIIKQYIDNRYIDIPLATIGIGDFKKDITINSKKISLGIWDTPGQEKNRSLSSPYLQNSNIVLLVYDITSERSFKELNDWIQHVNKIVNKEEVIIGIAANKYDLYERQEVIKEEGEQFAKENNCLFYETSAKDYESVKNAFEGLVRAYIEQIEKKEKSILNKDTKIEYKKKKYNNEDIYEGNFINDLKEGKGIMKYNNGDIYDGNWKNDLKEGNGILKIKNGNEYEGEWINNIFIKGKIKYKNGEIYNGEYKDNKREGFSEMKYNNGDIYKGNWINDKIDGKE